MTQMPMLIYDSCVINSFVCASDILIQHELSPSLGPILNPWPLNSSIGIWLRWSSVCGEQVLSSFF